MKEGRNFPPPLSDKTVHLMAEILIFGCVYCAYCTHIYDYFLIFKYRVHGLWIFLLLSYPCLNASLRF